jgi:hypothetical protein
VTPRREILVVAVLVLAGTLAASLALLSGGRDPGRPGPAQTEREPGGARGLRAHRTLSGPYLEGAVSTISRDRLELYVVPPRPERPQVTFAIPPELQRDIDFDHLRADASSGVDFRVYYRRDGDVYVLRGFAHPEPGAS